MPTKLGPRSEFTAATGLKLPVIGLGTALNKDEAVLRKTLNAALEIGYPLLDTASMYDNEEIIGKVLKEWMDNGKLRRRDIFITTKLPPQGNKPECVRQYLEKQLKALQLDYVDLYLIHHPVGFKPDTTFMSGIDGLKALDVSTDLVALWKEMENMVDAGLTKYIGLSNFNVKQIDKIVQNARIKPSNLQIELYIYQQAKEQQEYCKKNGITITSYSTLGSMGVFDAGIPRDMFQGIWENPLTDTDVLALAKIHKKTPAQVLLRHMLQLGIAIIPKSSNPERLKENFNIFDFQLSKPEMLRLGVLDRGEEGRRFVVESISEHPEYPYQKKS
ncbi:prostaglandin F synthase 2-like [Homalodisca vitripennis]|nr:prostaglandin F synthase 2-like [Homalodisca vitripennis]